MKPVRNLFLLSAFTKLPLPNSGALSAVRGWGQRRGFSAAQLQTSRGVGTTIQTSSSPEHVTDPPSEELLEKPLAVSQGQGCAESRLEPHCLQGSTSPCTALGPACARVLLALPGALCPVARGEVLELGKIHAWSCRGGWCSGVPQKEPYQPATA